LKNMLVDYAKIPLALTTQYRDVISVVKNVRENSLNRPFDTFAQIAEAYQA
jgi:hypothetical protein